MLGNIPLATTILTCVVRNFELCGLQAQDIEWNLQGAAPYHVPYFRVHLDGRKGWQSKQGWDGPLESMSSFQHNGLTKYDLKLNTL